MCLNIVSGAMQNLVEAIELVTEQYMDITMKR